jgi:N-carbamoylputrescine amidase
MVAQQGHAACNGLPVVAVNRVGLEPDPSGNTRGIRFWGSSFMAGPQGEIIVQSPMGEEENRVVEIDLNRSEEVRRWWPFFRDRRIDAYEGLMKRFIDKGGSFWNTN